MKKIKRFYLIILAAFLFFSSGPVLLANENDPQATGLKLHTEEELKDISKNWRNIKKIKPNQLGLERLNNARKKKGLAEIDKSTFAAPGEDITSEVDEQGLDETAETPKSELLSEYLILPSYVNNSQLACFPAIRSQGSLGSCAAFATTYYQLTHMAGLMYGWDNKNTDNTRKFSPKWTYNMVNGGNDNGSNFYSNYSLLQKHGAATWADFPYDSNYRQWCLNPDAWQKAISYRTNPTEYVTNVHTDAGLSQLKELLNNGYVLVFGTYIDSWRYTKIKDDPSTNADDEFVGKDVCFWVNGTSEPHAMTVVGYNDDIWVDINNNNIVDSGEKGALLIANSWGTGWGDGGFSWFAYDALKGISAVSGAPITGRVNGWHSSLAFLITVKPNYSPTLLAKFTVNHAKRNQLSIGLGSSELNQDYPYGTWMAGAITGQGGEYAFDGTASGRDGTFVFDFTDLIDQNYRQKRYYLRVTDWDEADPALLKDFRVIDLSDGGLTLVAEDTPQTVSSETVYVPINYISDFSIEDINQDGAVNVLDIAECIKVILGTQDDPGVVERAQKVAPPLDQTDVLDIVAIINKILAL